MFERCHKHLKDSVQNPSDKAPEMDHYEPSDTHHAYASLSELGQDENENSEPVVCLSARDCASYSLVLLGRLGRYLQSDVRNEEDGVVSLVVAGIPAGMWKRWTAKPGRLDEGSHSTSREAREASGELRGSTAPWLASSSLVVLVAGLLRSELVVPAGMRKRCSAEPGRLAERSHSASREAREAAGELRGSIVPCLSSSSMVQWLGTISASRYACPLAVLALAVLTLIEFVPVELVPVELVEDSATAERVAAVRAARIIPSMLRKMRIAMPGLAGRSSEAAAPSSAPLAAGGRTPARIEAHLPSMRRAPGSLNGTLGQGRCQANNK